MNTTVVQGIPTLYAPSTTGPSTTGELTAGLMFRVGRADETLATAGITHLVEHLALHRLGLSDLHYNGATATTYTLFHVTGTEAEVVTYLNSVCAALRELPLERLETEKEILRTEAAGRGGSSQLPLWRYGAQGYGLTSYSELGTWSLTPDAVRYWAQTRFTRDNAALWITGDHVPAGLDLTLPPGTRIPAPAATSALPVTPAYVCGDDGQVVLSSVVRRSAAAMLFADLFGRALFHDLRQEGGYSYQADADYSPRDAEYATITAYADALPQKQDAVIGGFVDTLARLRAGTFTQQELDSSRARLLKQYDDPGAGLLPGNALSLLLGRPVRSAEERRAELTAVTLADVHEVAQETWAGALLQVPGRGVDWAGFTLAPQYSTTSLSGTSHRHLSEDGVTLTIAPDGVTLTTPGGPVTVPYGSCAAMTARPDGSRTLTGHDGFSVTVEPTLYKGVTPDRIAAIDAAVPPHSVVHLPPRDPSRIPTPERRPSTSPAPARSTPAWTLGLWTLGLLTAFWALLSTLITTDSTSTADVIVTVWIMWLPLVAGTVALYRARRRRR
ncbi:insulinase family protein [Streptomyces roseirectus]|uniref:Insulinase family protein n=1 Tax=Streptomyces roseirectus TaxID=2768066 RepID=A0A7H0ID68_9ACTN|nr:insulinase family protein [Streptomyces roseirectus]QNP70734.1 insulinase family protein [Streptomyces roseirectus]